MLEDTPKTKNVYVPLALIGLAVVLMLVEVLFLGNHASHGALEVLSTVVGKTIMYGLVLLQLRRYSHDCSSRTCLADDVFEHENKIFRISEISV